MLSRDIFLVVKKGVVLVVCLSDMPVLVFVAKDDLRLHFSLGEVRREHETARSRQLRQMYDVMIENGCCGFPFEKRL